MSTVVLDPLDLLTPDLFDLPAKLMAAQEILDGRSSWGVRTYLELIRCWNGFYEYDPYKMGTEDFLSAFKQILFDVRADRFDWDRSPIPTFKGRVCNGRHRLAAAIALEKAAKTDETGEAPCDANWAYFQSRGLSALYADSIAIEFCRLKWNSRIAVVFGPHDRSQLRDALAPAGQVFYEKAAYLKNQGPLNLVRELYHGEEWLPVHGQTKANLCFLPVGRGLVTFYALDCRHLNRLRECKDNIRLNNGHHFIHTNDTHWETMRLARALLNDNGIHFLNHAKGDYRVPTCGRTPVDSGSVLAAYGLRPSNDVDFVDDDLHMEFQGVPLQDLTDDPRNFFWAGGVKYSSIEAVRRMKTNRNEIKDRRDLALMESL